MPLLDPTLVQTLMSRELAKDKERARFEAPPPPDTSVPSRPLSPIQSMLMGSAMDGASTYQALKRGTGKEGNAMWQGMSPLATGLSVGLLGPALHYGLGKISPKLADMVSSQLGARQMALGGENLYGSHSDQSSDQRVNQKLDPSIPLPSGSPFVK